MRRRRLLLTSIKILANTELIGSNLGNAKVAGLADDLSLTGTQYNLSATVRDRPL